LLNEQGINFPEDGIYTLGKTIREDPALAQAFVAASLEGWRYAFDHPEEALDIVIKYMREAQQPANRMHQKWMLERMRDLMVTGNAQSITGLLNEQDYQAVGSVLSQEGLIQGYPDYKSFTGRNNAGEK